MDLPEKGHYDSTISESKDASLAKAMEIMMQDIKKNQKIQVITRPKVSIIKGVIPIILIIGSYVALLINSNSIADYVSIKKGLLIILITLVYIGITAILLKKLLIWLILLYQRFAPEKVRKLCFFEPSCSEYMKLSIEKYGVIKGVYKGFNRLRRCHWPNGGIDYP